MREPDPIAHRLERARDLRGLSIAELARRSEIPMSTLYAIRSGYRRGEQLTLEKAMRLATVLNISIDWLCGFLEGDDSLSPPNADTWRCRALEGWQDLRRCGLDDGRDMQRESARAAASIAGDDVMR